MTSREAPTGPRDPDFIVIGAMKAGTTTLYDHFRSHPGVFMAEPKEPNYFSIDDVHARGRDWYRELFAEAPVGAVCGEASPSYTRKPRFADAAPRMAAELPGVKLIYIMRHPIERFYSNYVFDRSFGFTDTLRETLTNRPYVLETSRYIAQIRNYLEWFPRENLLPLVLDDLKTDAGKVLSSVAEFLGIAHFAAVGSSVAPSNPRGQQHAIRQSNKLLRTLRSAPGARTMTRVMPQSTRAAGRRFLTETLPRSFVGQWLSRQRLRRVEPLTPELRDELHARLDPSTSELEAFLGRDLSHWRQAAGGAPA